MVGWNIPSKWNKSVWLHFRDLVATHLSQHHCSCMFFRTWNAVLWLHCFHFPEVYITLDGKIRHGCVPLIEALRRLQCGPVHRDVPWDAACPENTPTWGAQTFTAGKHYWEVDVGNSGDWVIGLCKESWTSRNDMLLNSEDIFLLLCVSKDGHFSLFSTFPFLPHYIQRPQGYIGVFLDYECGMISFINVARGSLICNFLSRSFSFPLRPFIWCGPKWSGTGHKPNQGFGNSSSWGGSYPGDF